MSRDSDWLTRDGVQAGIDQFWLHMGRAGEMLVGAYLDDYDQTYVVVRLEGRTPQLFEFALQQLREKVRVRVEIGCRSKAELDAALLSAARFIGHRKFRAGGGIDVKTSSVVVETSAAGAEEFRNNYAVSGAESIEVRIVDEDMIPVPLIGY